MNTRGFSLVREERLSEVSGTVKLWRHDATGAELLSIVNNDENKCFGATFRTPPKDSTGVAHILEHSVLCGSEKYPVKEPFVELLKGSLQTFLNAFTFPDKTCYGHATFRFRQLRRCRPEPRSSPVDDICFRSGRHTADSLAGSPATAVFIE
ncbi:MAG: insulinase family protein [Bilophila wadsworthia]